MSGQEKHSRARERLRAAQAGAGGAHGVPAGRGIPQEAPADATPAGPRAGAAASSGPPTGEHPGAWSEQHAAARTEGLELTGVLGTGRGTRTWLATERHSREKFTVTFSTAPDAAQRAAQHRALRLLAGYWAGRSHDHLVAVRALLGEDSAPALVTDHVAAASLATVTVQDGRLPPARLTPVLVAVATALATLHEQGWVHGTLTAQRVLLSADGQVWLDGYGLPCRNTSDDSGPPHAPGATDVPGAAAGPDAADAPAPSWGHDDRPEPPERSTARTPPEDVRALATLAWHALTGRYPGSAAHRVPLTLVCPAAPRGLVLVLEAALQDDPQRRPTAREFAAGVAALPVPKPTTRGAEPTRIIRANGTVETVRTRPRASRRTPEVLRALRHEDGNRFSALAATLRRPGHRWPAAALAGTAVLLVAGWAGWSQFGPGEPTAADSAAATASGDAAAGREAKATTNGSAATGGPPTAGGPHAPEATATPENTPAAGDRGRPTGSGSPSDAVADERVGEAERAVRELVARRTEALAAGDEEALAAVYAPEAAQAGQDRETVARALAQRGPGTEYSALSGLSMEVDTIHPVPTPAVDGRPGAGTEDAGVRTFYAEVLTRGWHGELPEDSHVRREDTAVRQSLRITVTRTTAGWRLADVTPVAPQE